MENDLPDDLKERAAVLALDMHKLVARASRAGAAALGAELAAHVDGVIAEMQRAYDNLTEEDIALIHACFENTKLSPIVAAKYGGAGIALMDVAAEIRRRTPQPDDERE